MEITDFEVEYLIEDGSSDIETPALLEPEDAYVVMLNQRGGIYLEDWSSRCGLSVEELISRFNGKLMWLDPEVFELSGDITSGWLTKGQYVQGNVRRKLEVAEKLHERTGLFDANIQILKQSMPDMVAADDIFVNMGATWVPIPILQQFIGKILGSNMVPSVTYDSFLGRWMLTSYGMTNYVNTHFTYGTNRMNAEKIILHILNAKPVKIYDQIPRLDRDGCDSVLNQVETLAAQEKEKLIMEEWQSFIHGNQKIQLWLQEEYAKKYGYTVSHYDGSFLTLADMDSSVKLYPHQKNAIARIVLTKNVLLAHDVGAGKTYEFEAGIHELIRIGLGKKAAIVVPNNTLEAAAEAYRQLYPEDRILVVHPKKEFSTKERKKTMERIASDEYQILLFPYSSFDMITMSKAYRLNEMDEQIRTCLMQLHCVTNGSVRKKLQAEKKRLEKERAKLEEKLEDTPFLAFDQLGIDILCVDEAHNYKNISIDRATQNIVGMHASGSKRSDEMLRKVAYVQKKQGRVIFATGTPLCNSLADLYIMQRFLQPQELKLLHIYHFSNWINTFAKQEHSFEIDVDSSNFRFTTRFGSFYNLPELMSIFSGVCDFYQIEKDVGNLPDFNGYTDVLVKKTEPLRIYIETLAERTDAIRKRQVKRDEDNLLKVTVDGRAAALDIRLVDDHVDAHSLETKVMVCADHMAKLYHTKGDATQIAFCDISTPKAGFNLYDELKKELIKRGVDENQIMFIHDADSDAKRVKVEKLFNEGTVRILIGSTQKLGIGSNVQQRLFAIHHLDVPWRPADMAQREGRIIRQGNTNKEVFVYRYITESSFDAYTYQILENKQKFISQFLSGSLSAVHRQETDCADTVLSFAEIKALAVGNPMIKERVQVSNELEHARINQRQKRKELGEVLTHLNQLPGRIQNQRHLIAATSADIRYYDSAKQRLGNELREEFGNKLLAALGQNVMLDENQRFELDYQGFQVVLPKHMKADLPYVLLIRQGGGLYKIKMDTDKPLGCAKKLDHILEHLRDTKKEQEETLQSLEEQREKARKELDEGNIYDGQVARLANRLAEIDKALMQ